MITGVMAQMINVLILAISYPVYLHFLGYKIYGLWLALGVVPALAQMGDLGIRTAVMKLVAEELGKGNYESIRKYVTIAVWFLAGMGLVGLGLILIFKTQIIVLFRFDSEDARLASWLLPYIGLLSVYVLILQTFKATLSGLGRMDLANGCETIGRAVTLSLAIILFYQNFNISSLLVSTAVSYVVQHLFCLIMIRRLVPIRFTVLSCLDVRHFRSLFRFGLGIFGGSLVTLLLDPFNRLMLSRYAGVDAIPIYDIAYRGARQIRSLADMGLRALMPEISRLKSGLKEYAHRIRQINHLVMKVILLVGLPLFTLLFLCSAPLLKFWLGVNFSPALPPVFKVLLIGTYVSLLGIPGYYTLMGINRVRDCFMSHLILAALSALVVIMIQLSPLDLSTLNVSYAVSTGYLVTTVFVLYRKNQVLNECAV